MSAEVRGGDCRELLATLPEGSVDSIVTDPPYDLTSARPGGRSPATEGKVMRGFMGMTWDASGIAFDPAMWAAALRVLKPGGHLLAFGGSRTYHRMACAIEDAGFEIRDQIMWIYGSGFPKSKNLDGEREGWGTALKPAHEPIVLARKPLIGSVAATVAAHGTGAMNIDGCRIHGEDARGGSYTVTRLKPGADLNKTGGNWRPEEGGIAFHGEMKPGRWPANVIHDGSDEVVSTFPAAPGQQGYVGPEHGPRKSLGIFGDFGARPPSPPRGDNGRAGEPSADSANGGAVGFQMKPGARRPAAPSAARFFYCAKASPADRDEGLDGFALQAFVQFQTANGTSGKASSLSDGRETQYRNTHPTVKPTALMRYLVRLVTPPGGLVLDPFTGSGSTGKAAVLEGFDFLGCELTEEYLPIARARIAAAEAQRAADVQQGSLFSGEAA